MNIGVLTVRGMDFHPNRRLAEAASRSGHSLLLIDPYLVTAAIGRNGFDCTVRGMAEKPDIILPRQGALMGDYGLVLIRQLERMGIPLVNGSDGVSIARHQFHTLQILASAGLPVPETFFITGAPQIPGAVKQLGGYPVVMKQVSGMGGEGVAMIHTADAAEHFVAHSMADKKGALVQEYIRPADRKDIRLFVIGHQVAGAMALTPGAGEFRANIHQNGRAEAYTPDHQLEKMAVGAAKACRLEVAGIDIIVGKNRGPHLIEINYSPGFRGIEAATGKDMASRVIQYAAAKQAVSD